MGRYEFGIHTAFSSPGSETRGARGLTGELLGKKGKIYIIKLTIMAFIYLTDLQIPEL